MGEVLFYRGLLLVMVIGSIIVLYRIIQPWVKALCVHLELEGKEVLKKAEKEAGAVPLSENPPRKGFLERTEDTVHSYPGDHVPGAVTEGDPSAAQEISVLAAETMNSRIRVRRPRPRKTKPEGEDRTLSM